ncbi:Cupredoxin [Periconia macrospinosa]|uniref:Cupredoxin n=1 Tax=Periconia macrospinosa TaxID=97972 RepID=A0A2V1EBH1_9PLEO|nr:Cupredoxin [Periconia macrospinosa]
MFSKLIHMSVGFLILNRCNAQAQNKFSVEIPESERVALENIIEDDAGEEMSVQKDWESPEYPLLFRSPLPIPPVLQPKLKMTNPVTGKEMWYYEMEIRPFTQQVYPTLRPARLVGYNGISPGPTIIVPRGTESVVRFVNNADKENSVHLHGSPSRAPFDGWADDLTFPGQYKDYYYPNNQAARFLWYHDHAIHITAENAYFGQAGAYLITDPAEDALGLPSGYGEFDIPLVLASKYYNQDGTLQTSVGEDQSLWGDIIHVNGQPWPFFNVQPRKYRLRFLNAAVSRNFALYFVRTTATNTRIPFQVIATDAGLTTHPVQTSDLYVSVAERYEIVFDFSAHAGQTIELKNFPQANGIGTDDDYEHTDKVMRFVVGNDPVNDDSTVPSSLRPPTAPLEINSPASTGIDHHFRFHRSNSEWRINDVGFADAKNRILAKVPRGKIEIWELENGSGGWTHPIHIHLVDFKVLERYGSESTRGVMPYESAGLKDVVWLGRHETVLVEAHYAPWSGVYMFHCHNLIHEDQDMMAAFNVTELANWGYNETDFSDPEDPRYAAKPYNKADFTGRSGPFTNEAIEKTIADLALEQPYSQLQEVEKALEEAWATNPQKRDENCDSTQAGPVPRYRRFMV